MSGADRIPNLLRGVPRRRRAEVERELRSHLEECRRDLVLSGWQPEIATREAERRLGDDEEIAFAFTATYRRSRGVKAGTALMLASAMILSVWGVSGTLASAKVTQHHPITHSITGHLNHRAARP